MKKRPYIPVPGSINDKADQLIKLIRKAGKDSAESLNALLELGTILCECSIASPNEYLQDYKHLYTTAADNRIKIQSGLALIEILTCRKGKFSEALQILDTIKMLASSPGIDIALQNKVGKSSIFLSIHFRWFDDALKGLKYFEKSDNQFDRSWYMMASGYIDFLQSNTFSFHKFRNATDGFNSEFQSYKDHSDLYRALLCYQAKETENARLQFEKLRDSHHPKTRLFAHLGVACCTNSKEDYQKYLSLFSGDTGEWSYQFRFYRQSEWLPMHIKALQHDSNYTFKKIDNEIRSCLEPHQKTFYALGNSYKEKSEYALLLSSIAKERLLFLERNIKLVETHHFLSVLEKTRYPVENFRNPAINSEAKSIDSAKTIIDLMPANHAIVYLAELQNDTALLWHSTSSKLPSICQLLKNKDSEKAFSDCLKKVTPKTAPKKIIIGIGCEEQKNTLHGKAYSHYKGKTAVLYSTNHYRLANKLIDGSYFAKNRIITKVALFHPSYTDKSAILNTTALNRKIAARKLSVSKIDKFCSDAFADSPDTIVIVSHGPECNGVPCIDTGNEKVTIDNIAAWPTKALAGKNILLLVCTASQQLGHTHSVLSIPEIMLNKGANLVMASVDIVRENEFSKVFEDFLRILEDKPVNYSKKWRVII